MCGDFFGYEYLPDKNNRIPYKLTDVAKVAAQIATVLTTPPTYHYGRSPKVWLAQIASGAVMSWIIKISYSCELFQVLDQGVQPTQDQSSVLGADILPGIS